MPIKTKIPSTVRNSVWNMYIGIGQKQGICFCCNTEFITSANFECGHVQAKSKNGDTTIQNLRPVCGLCNKSMGTINMETFMSKYGFTKNNNWNGIVINNNNPNPNVCNETNIKCHKTEENEASRQKNMKQKISTNQTVNKKSKDDDFKKYLESLLVKQLQQICIIFGINYGGTKPKLINKIINGKITLNEFLNKIDTSKKYLIKCDGFEYCELCKINIKNGYDDFCKICNKKTYIDYEHIYYTNDKILNDSLIAGIHKENIAKCNVCNKITYIEEYDNNFLDLVLPISTQKDNQDKNINGEMYRYLDNFIVKQLKQICIIFSISCKGTKLKLIENIIENKITKEDINNKVNENKKYLIHCNGFEYCNECKNKIIRDIYTLCKKCTKEDPKDQHCYYTNNKILVDNINCKICNKRSSRSKYENAFYEEEEEKSGNYLKKLLKNIDNQDNYLF